MQSEKKYTHFKNFHLRCYLQSKGNFIKFSKSSKNLLDVNHDNDYLNFLFSKDLRSTKDSIFKKDNFKDFLNTETTCSSNNIDLKDRVYELFNTNISKERQQQFWD